MQIETVADRERLGRAAPFQMTYDSDLFRGAATFYDRHRAPYAEDAIAFLADRLELDRGARLLDLGCGPGTLARRFARDIKVAVAVDPDFDMLAEGRRLAASEGVLNIEWVQAGSVELGQFSGPFRAVVMGQSFHWMDRDQVLRDCHRLVEDGGSIALINPGRRRPQEAWEPIAAEVIERYLGAPQSHRQRSSEPHHEPALRRSAFEIADDLEFKAKIARDIPSILGAIYSISGTTPWRFGERRSAFERDLEAALRDVRPSGLFHEDIETGVLVAKKT